MAQTASPCRGDAAPQSLEDLLAPVGADQFRQSIWGKTFQHFPGWPGKYASLLPWSDLNRILRQHRLQPTRLRLMKEGKPVPAEAYLAFRNTRRSERIPRVFPAGMAAELREGATLVLDSIDELQEPVTTLAENLERVFHVRVQVNGYAGWRTSRGFDLHWDDHDVFVLQVAGRKRWKVYPMTKPHPLPKDEVTPPDAEAPLWDGLLEDGDMLYIPRGWWHVALPLDEPTLHLTVGFTNPTGADLVTWVGEKLRACVEVRRDLPLFETAEEKAAYCERIREAILAVWNPDLVDEYLEHVDSKAQPRAQVGLPWTPTVGLIPPSNGSTRVKWTPPRPVDIYTAGEQVELAANGRSWQFASPALPLLQHASTAGTTTLDGLYRHSQLDVATFEAFVRELLSTGLLAIVDSESGGLSADEQS